MLVVCFEVCVSYKFLSQHREFYHYETLVLCITKSPGSQYCVGRQTITKKFCNYAFQPEHWKYSVGKYPNFLEYKMSHSAPSFSFFRI